LEKKRAKYVLFNKRTALLKVNSGKKGIATREKGKFVRQKKKDCLGGKRRHLQKSVLDSWERETGWGKKLSRERLKKRDG